MYIQHVFNFSLDLFGSRKNMSYRTYVCVHIMIIHIHMCSDRCFRIHRYKIIVQNFKLSSKKNMEKIEENT